MRIRNVIHKRSGEYVKDDNSSGLQSVAVSKMRHMLTFLQDMQSEDELRSVPSWKAHLLTGNRKGTWSLSVTRSWRLTFRVAGDENEIIDLGYEDYH